MKYELTAKRIRLAMDRMNLSQQELANRCAIGKSSISHYVNGTNEPGNKTAYILAQALNVNPAWLMGFDAPMEPVIAPGTDSSFGSDQIVRTKEADELYERIQSLPQDKQIALREYLRFLLSDT